ncbi:MAG TPA: malto-oligosyltrehalose trehalohydrolase [Frankiaceae bacterium]|nr:malto-oligosyltrehalose trehalohydrolase [Frankiaceae bacterium]
MARFDVWAPAASAVEVDIAEPSKAAGRTALSLGDDGWWGVDVPDAAPGDDYSFRLGIDGGEPGEPLPDPRSRWQPHGVDGPSRLYDDAAFTWTDDRWRGLPLAGSVLYELHVGTFTDEGTFDAAVEKLDHLVDLGVDAVELLPVNAFGGVRGWGYDGVDLFAVHDPYGGPDGLKRLVDACHARGLGVVMDVVYNHLGPAGNYLGRFGPYFTDTHVTPWGSAVNLDAPGSDGVRAFILDNARMWLRDFHIDGLRLDAVHALADERAIHVLEELAATVEQLGAQTRRPLFLIAESDLNDPKLIRSRQSGGYGLDAQWCDDVHHALWATLSGERQGYYVDFGPLAVLAKAMTKAFVHDGSYSTFRGRRHGRPATGVAAHRFVTFLQDHDQIGNRGLGDRATATLPDELLQVGAALLLLSPYTPMLFMGEEWGARTPWQFFSDQAGELGEAVRTGRRAEFAAHGWATGDVPDPQDPGTFQHSKLDWSEPTSQRGAALLDWYRKLLRLRRVEPDLTDPDLGNVHVSFDRETEDEPGSWFVLRRKSVAIAVNLGSERQVIPVPGTPVRMLLTSQPGFGFGDGAVGIAGRSVAVLKLI